MLWKPYDHKVDAIGVHKIKVLILRLDFRVTAFDICVFYCAEAYLEPSRTSIMKLFSRK